MIGYEVFSSSIPNSTLCAEIYEKGNYLKVLSRIKLLSKKRFADHLVQTFLFYSWEDKCQNDLSTLVHPVSLSAQATDPLDRA